MSTAYAVCNGTKLKGFWTEKQPAIDYLANRDEAERKEWSVVPVDLKAGFEKEVEERAAEIAKDRKNRRGKIVHHLKAEDVEVTASGKIVQ